MEDCNNFTKSELIFTPKYPFYNWSQLQVQLPRKNDWDNNCNRQNARDSRKMCLEVYESVKNWILCKFTIYEVSAVEQMFFVFRETF